MRNRTILLSDPTFNDLGVAIADKLDALMRENATPHPVREAVINLRNTADALLTTAEAAASAPALMHPSVTEPLRLAVGLMLHTCSRLPQPMMPQGDRLLLVPAEERANAGVRTTPH